MSRTTFLKSDQTSEKFLGHSLSNRLSVIPTQKNLEEKLDLDGGDKKRKRTPMYPEL